MALLTVIPIHEVEQYHEPVKITLIPYIDPTREFRCFVQKHRITAISQYMWHKDLGWKHRIEELTRIVDDIFEFHNMLDKSAMPRSYVMDVHANEEFDHIDLVEFNPMLACGSALFSWKDDEEQLYGHGDTTVPLIVSISTWVRLKTTNDYHLKG